MTRVGATEFKAKCLDLMDRVAQRSETFVITKRGRPVARLVPVEPPKRKDIFGCMAGRMEIVADIEKPLRTEREWSALERQRAKQARHWEREWRSHGTISGKKAMGQSRRRTRRKPGPKKPRRRARP